MNSMFLERISSFHKDNTEGQLTVHHHLTNNKTFLDYQRRTIAWMVNREETFSYCKLITIPISMILYDIGNIIIISYY